MPSLFYIQYNSKLLNVPRPVQSAQSTLRGYYLLPSSTTSADLFPVNLTTGTRALSLSSLSLALGRSLSLSLTLSLSLQADFYHGFGFVYSAFIMEQKTQRLLLPATNAETVCVGLESRVASFITRVLNTCSSMAT